MDILIDRSSSSTWKAILWSLGSDRVTRWDLRFGWRLSPISWLCRRRVWRICTKSRTSLWWQDFRWPNSDPRSTSWGTCRSLPMRRARQYGQRRPVARRFRSCIIPWDLDCTWPSGWVLCCPILTWSNLWPGHLRSASKQSTSSWWPWCSWFHQFRPSLREAAQSWLRPPQEIAELELAHCCFHSPSHSNHSHHSQQ